MCFFQAKTAKEGESLPVKKKRPVSVEYRKCRSAMTALTEIFETLQDVLKMGGPVKDVVLSLGATIVSPKELYIISFPVGVYDGTVMNIRTCRSFLFKNLFSCDFFHDVDPPSSCLKMTVLVCATKHCHFAAEKLLPKLKYKLPQKGKRLHLNMSCNAHEVSPELSHMDEIDANLSGFEPLEMTPATDKMHSRMRKISKSSLPPIDELNTEQHEHGTCVYNYDNAYPSPVNDISVHGEEDTCNDMDFIWFQVPVTMTGFCLKNSSKTNNSIWAK